MFLRNCLVAGAAALALLAAPAETSAKPGRSFAPGRSFSPRPAGRVIPGGGRTFTPKTFTATKTVVAPKRFVTTKSFVKTKGVVGTKGFVKTKGLTTTKGFVKTKGVVNTKGILKTKGIVKTKGFAKTKGFVKTNGFVKSKGFVKKTILKGRPAFLRGPGGKNIKTALYASKFGFKTKGGLFAYKGRRHGHWARKCFIPRLRCWMWYCPSACNWYYWSGTQACYLPMDYLPNYAPEVPLEGEEPILPPGANNVPLAANNEVPNVPQQGEVEEAEAEAGEAEAGEAEAGEAETGVEVGEAEANTNKPANASE